MCDIFCAHLVDHVFAAPLPLPPAPRRRAKAGTNLAKVPLDRASVVLTPERFMVHRFAIGAEFIGIRLPVGALAPLISPAPRFLRHPERYASVHLKALKPNRAFAALSPNHATSNFSAKGILRLKPAKSERRNAAESLKTPPKSVERPPP